MLRSTEPVSESQEFIVWSRDLSPSQLARLAADSHADVYEIHPRAHASREAGSRLLPLVGAVAVVLLTVAFAALTGAPVTVNVGVDLGVLYVAALAVIERGGCSCTCSAAARATDFIEINDNPRTSQ